ncbi:hypothetical protein CO038_02225 [Candidatus Pacearchaeota archaeon CG_4_9_14_0_2_um_filter_39_13]|nr:hypothetical protein [Candidatus Pacearchaeota archaeon]PJC44762.1 MAG: hypothetical protein CO038_02225 [Candidatus Pacearchaeota archaeon CG_4_9_14_0_2_um_filter_39_13]
MNCNCKWTETVLALVIIVFALWADWMYSQWIVVIAAILLLIHAWACKSCANCRMKEMPRSSSRPKRRKRR